MRDSFASDYFKRTDSLPYNDTSNISYKLFKAYYLNDTVFLKAYQKEIVDNKKWDSSWSLKDSCIHQPPLIALNVNETYRFIYSCAFCDQKLILTVADNGNSVILNSLLYVTGEEQGCHIVSEQNIKLDSLQWATFLADIDYSDFWGLLPDNGFSENDGDKLDVLAYKKNSIEIKTHKIHRRDLTRTTIYKPFLQLFKYSCLKQVCFLNSLLLKQQHID